MLDAAGKLGKIVVGMNRALGDIPVTVKLRTGVKDGKNTAHKLMPRLGPEFGVSAITVGCQRYTSCLDSGRCSYTGELGNNDTQNLPIGTTSGNASRPCVPANRMKAVRLCSTSLLCGES